MVQKRDRKRRGLRFVPLGIACGLLGLLVMACTQLLNLSPSAWVTPSEDAHLRGTSDALAYEAVLYLVTPNPFEAIELLNEAIALQPDVAEYHFYMGEANFYLRAYQQAIEWFDSAIALDPDFLAAYRFRGEAAMLLEDDNLAKLSFEQVLEMGFCDRFMISSLNQIYLRMDEQRDASTHESCQAIGARNVEQFTENDFWGV